jgi:hypothetical protein
MKGLLEFFQTLLKLLSTELGGKEDEEAKDEISDNASAKDIYAWLLKKMKDPKAKDVLTVTSAVFDPGKIYIFKYDPLYKDSYSFWDEHPIIVSLGRMPAKQGFMNVGVNLSWYPPAARVYMLDSIMKIYKGHIEEQKKKFKGDAKRQKGVPIDLLALKSALDQAGFSFAIRNYLPSQIKSPSYCISFEHWKKMSKLDIPATFPQLKGNVGIFKIYKDFEDYVKYCRQNRTKMMKKMEENKKLMKYKFIK